MDIVLSCLRSSSLTPNCQTLRENACNFKSTKKRPYPKNLIVRIFSWVKFEETRDPVVVFLIINESPASAKCQKQDKENIGLSPVCSDPLIHSLPVCFSPLMFKFAGKYDPAFIYTPQNPPRVLFTNWNSVTDAEGSAPPKT